VVPGRIPATLHEELRALRRQCGALACAELLTHAGAIARLLAWTRNALSSSHLVAVAHALHRTLGAGVDDLRTLRVPVDILREFPAWRTGSRAGFRPVPLGVTPRPAGAREPLRAIRMHVAPADGMTPLALTILRGLLARLDGAVRFVLFVEPEVDLDRLQELARAYGAWDERRVRLVAVRSATLYSQDNARAAVDAHGFPVLQLPRAFRPELGRDEESMSASEAERALGVRVIQSRTYWEGGNVLHDETHCLVGADTIAENRVRLGLTTDEATRLLEADLGVAVHALGDASTARYDADRDGVAPSGQATFHIDLDVALLGRVGRGRRPVALLADPARGLRLLDGVLRDRRTTARHLIAPARIRRPLAAEYQASANERTPILAGYRKTLERLGYLVIGMPDLRLRREKSVFGETRLDFTYCNVLPGLNAKRATVHYLPWGIRALDRAAEARFRAAGVTPVAVSSDPAVAHALMRYSAGLHCFCGSLP
jgi:hypothetical protein